MTKPALVGPTYKIRQCEAFSAANRILRHIREVYSQAHYGTPGQIHALETSLVNMQNWRFGDDDIVWLVEANTHTAASLLWSAGDLEMRGLATPEQVADLRMAGKNFKSYVKTAEPVAPVIDLDRVDMDANPYDLEAGPERTKLFQAQQAVRQQAADAELEKLRDPDFGKSVEQRAVETKLKAKQAARADREKIEAQAEDETPIMILPNVPSVGDVKIFRVRDSEEIIDADAGYLMRLSTNLRRQHDPTCMAATASRDELRFVLNKLRLAGAVRDVPGIDTTPRWAQNTAEGAAVVVIR